jgi:hypothetical protein
MENNQNEKVSITFEVEKEFIKAVMLVSGISMKDSEEVMNELDNVVINEDTLQDLETMDGDIQQIKTGISMIAIGMAYKKITAKEMQSKPSGLFAKLQSLKEESKRLGKEEWK